MSCGTKARHSDNQAYIEQPVSIMRHGPVIAGGDELTGQVISFNELIRVIDEQQSTESKNFRHLIPHTRISRLVDMSKRDVRPLQKGATNR